MNEEAVENTDANDSKEASKPETMTPEQVENLVKNILTEYECLNERIVAIKEFIKQEEKELFSEIYNEKIFSKNISKMWVERHVQRIVDNNIELFKVKQRMKELMELRGSYTSEGVGLNKDSFVPNYPRGHI